MKRIVLIISCITAASLMLYATDGNRSGNRTGGGKSSMGSRSISMSRNNRPTTTSMVGPSGRSMMSGSHSAGIARQPGSSSNSKSLTSIRRQDTSGATITTVDDGD